MLDYYTKSELMDMGFAFVGENVKVFRKAQIINTKNVYLDHNCQIDDFVYLVASQNVHIGKRCHIAAFTSFIGGGEITICDYACIAIGTRLISGSDDFSKGNGMIGPCIPIEFRCITRSKIIFNKHSICGANSVILPGVIVGEGSAIGASSLVNKNTEAWGIYVGAPAQKIGERTKSKILGFETQLKNKYGY